MTDKIVTVRNLINLLESIKQKNLPVYLEGCDCIGMASGHASLLINLDNKPNNESKKFILLKRSENSCMMKVNEKELFLKACRIGDLKTVKEFLFICASFNEHPFLLKDIEIDPSENDNEALKITLHEAINTTDNEKRYNLWEIIKLLLEDDRVKNNLSIEHKDNINIFKKMMTSSEYNKELEEMALELEYLMNELPPKINCTTCIYGEVIYGEGKDKQFMCEQREVIEDWCDKWERKADDCDYEMKAINKNTFTFEVTGKPKEERDEYKD